MISPKIIQTDDYHEIEHLNQTFKIINKDIKVVEIGFSAPMYIALVYCRNKPCKDHIDQLLKKEGIELE